MSKKMKISAIIIIFVLYLSLGYAYPDSEGDCELEEFPDTSASGGTAVPSKTTRQQCEDHCLFYPTCWGYDWTEGSTSCTIHEKSTYDQRNGQSGTFHVEIGETCKKNKRAVYLGCFIHAALYMPVRVGGEDGVQYVTTQQVVQRCAALRFRYAAIEYDGTWPWCGDQFHRDGGLDVTCQAASARLVCAGDPNDRCGGGDRLAVYEMYPRPWKNGPSEMVLEELGCFNEFGLNRDLPFFIAGYTGWNGHSYNFCAGLCAAAGYQYTGLISFSQCWCGDSYGKHGSTTGCGGICKGGFYGDECGGVWRHSILNITSVTLVLDPPYKELGCFADTDVNDVKLEFDSHVGQIDRTPENCIHFCYAADARYAAMNAGNCYCGGVYGTNRKVSDSLCNSACHEISPGGLNCGGPRNYYYIYQLGTDYCPIDSDDPIWNKMYKGCWEDKNVNIMFDASSAATRDFEVYVIQNGFVPWYGITLNRCVQACKTLGYRYAALQATRCFCGNNYGRYKAMDEFQCSGDANTCGGDLKGVCGTADRSAVYDTYLGDLSSCSISYGLVDECSDGTHNCDGNATCYDTPTSFICHCNTNYNGTGEQGQCHQDCDLEEFADTGVSGDVGETIEFYVRTKNECLDYCINKTTCWGFDWVEDNKTCTVYTADDIDNMVVKVGSVHAKVGPFCIWRRRSKYLGCFEDPGTPRVLPVIVEASSYSNPQMSPETCVERCAAWNFRYAAMQQYHFCFCGNIHNSWSKATSEAECGAYCYGDPHRKCGGGWRNSVYEIHPLPFEYSAVTDTTGGSIAESYIGCHTWTLGGLNMAAEIVSSRLMTPAVCPPMCKILGYKYAAVKSTSCYCGDQLGASVDESNCNSVCLGDRVSLCGGSSHYSVYNTNNLTLASFLENSTAAPDYRYYGCWNAPGFVDAADIRIQPPGPQRTIENCLKICYSIEAPFAGMTGGQYCWCSGVVSPGTPLADTSCSTDCIYDPAGNKRKCGGSGNTVSIWKLEEEYCPFKSDDDLMKSMYIGCYQDQSIYDMSLRDFDQFINQDTEVLWRDMTVPRCLGTCATLGYRYGALSNGYRCFCGHTYGRYGRHGVQSTCENTCKGDGRGTCGANIVNAVYDLGRFGINATVPCSRGPPVDECSLELDDCDGNATCTDTRFYFKCECKPGFRDTGSGLGRTGDCEEINECLEESPCAENATCVDLVIGFNCTCDEGFTGDGLECEDIDECAPGASHCDGNANCANYAGSFACVCHSGFLGNGLEGNCTDIDECGNGTRNCDINANCTNSPGGYQCVCHEGYEGSGQGGFCADTDECGAGTHNCDPDASCSNSPFPYSCACNSGYTGDGVSCIDIDECTSDVDDCHNDANCTNTAGSFTCTCREGYTGNGTSCSDINECYTATHNCDPHASCSNSPFPYSCACNSGYTGNGFSCTDVTDECGLGTHNCDVNALCINNNVSFSCECLSGFNGTGTVGTCSDINECAQNTYTCDAMASCVNNVGSYTCRCKNDYIGDGTPGNCHSQMTKSGYYKRTSGSEAGISDGLKCIAECMSSNSFGRCANVKIHDNQCLFENGNKFVDHHYEFRFL